MKTLSGAILAAIFLACAPAVTYRVLETSSGIPYFFFSEISVDPTYGFTEGNPVKVGGVMEDRGPLNERLFLNALTGPGGEELEYERVGSCCPFRTSSSPFGNGLLDMYEVQIKGTSTTLTIYINMYDRGPLKAPLGLKCRP